MSDSSTTCVRFNQQIVLWGTNKSRFTCTPFHGSKHNWIDALSVVAGIKKLGQSRSETINNVEHVSSGYVLLDISLCGALYNRFAAFFITEKQLPDGIKLVISKSLREGLGQPGPLLTEVQRQKVQLCLKENKHPTMSDDTCLDCCGVPFQSPFKAEKHDDSLQEMGKGMSHRKSSRAISY